MPRPGILRIILPELRGQRLQLRLRLRLADAGLQPADDEHDCRSSRRSSHLRAGLDDAAPSSSESNISGANATSVPMKPFGVTPTTVNGMPLKCTVLPTIAGSEPKRRSQQP